MNVGTAIVVNQLTSKYLVDQYSGIVNHKVKGLNHEQIHNCSF